MAMTFNLNQPCADNSTVAKVRDSSLFFIKQNLLSIGWTVKASSDGTTYNATGDLWTTVASLANSASWILLESPAGIITGGTGKVWLTLQSSASSNCASIYAHNALPTGGTVSAAPTSTQQLAVLPNTVLVTNIAAAVSLNFTGWANGCFQVIGTINGVVNFYTAALPISDVSNNYPYAIAFKHFQANARLTIANLDTPLIWNRAGTSASAAGRFFYKATSDGVAVGKNIGTTGDYYNHHRDSEVELYNTNAANNEPIGKIGADSYMLHCTGSTAITMGLVVDAANTMVCIGSVFAPANASIIF